MYSSKIISSPLSSPPTKKLSIEKEIKVSKDHFQETFEWLLSNNNGFLTSLPGRKSDFLEIGEGMRDTLEWLKTVVLYNVPYGKQIRGRMVEFAYKELVHDASDDKLKLARVLGWCVEILQAAFLVADDIMDNGFTRRGQPCWHLVNNMGNIAFNDALILEHISFQLLRKHFSNSEMYTDLLDLFLGITFRTTLGQSLDTRTGVEQNYDKYTTSTYYSIVAYKTGYYTIYLPVALAMILAGISPKKQENQKLWQNVEDISLKIGNLFQIQDDYFDCFADEKELGKIGTDIQEGKCSWLFVTAKEHCTPDEYQVLKHNYGRDEIEKVAAVKKLYNKLSIHNLFNECLDKLYSDVCKNIKLLENEDLKLVLRAFLKKVYKRTY